MTTDSWFDLERELTKCMMIFNMRVDPVRTQMTNTQNMNNMRWVRKIFLISMSVLQTRANQKVSTQTRTNKKGYHQWILYKQGIIKKRSYKCQYNFSKDAKNETKDEESLVTDH